MASDLLPARSRAAGTRDGLAVTLTLLTGVTDAVAFTMLGSVFTSVMTGNMVLMGIALGHADASAIERVAIAFVAYIVGTAVGSRIAGRPRDDDRVWPAAVTRTLAVEAILFLAVAAIWWWNGSAPGGTSQTVLLVLSTLAMGMQSSAVLRLNVSGLSTTYLTGTLTTVIQALVVHRRLRGHGRSSLILAALIAGAAVGGVVALHAPAWVPVVQLGLLAVVIGVAVGRFRSGTA
jgi:uncharacterized membrane protein YoaK (UPF0700 family)